MLIYLAMSLTLLSSIKGNVVFYIKIKSLSFLIRPKNQDGFLYLRLENRLIQNYNYYHI